MKLNFIMGVLAGATLFGAATACAAALTAQPNQFDVKLNGEDVSIEGYNIEGSTYFRLRDIADVTGGFNVDFKDNTIILSTENDAASGSVTEAVKEDEEMPNETSKLLYQGHASFRLTTNTGKVIYIDPAEGEGYDVPADMILVTHQHPDHNQIDKVPKNEGCVIFQNSDAITEDGYKSIDFEGVHVEPVQAYNTNHDVKECVGYLVTVNNKVLYFAGDTSKTDQMAELKEKNIDYAFLPIDGHFNMDIPEAVECAKLIGAKHNVPIHMSPGKLFDLSRAQQFNAPNALIVEAGKTIDI